MGPLHCVCDGVAHHVGAQHHAGTATCGGVIDIAVLAYAKIPQIGGFHLPLSLFQGLACQAFAQHAGEGLREQSDNPSGPDPRQTGILAHQVLRLGAKTDGFAAMRLVCVRFAAVRQAAVGFAACSLAAWGFGCLSHGAGLARSGRARQGLFLCARV